MGRDDHPGQPRFPIFPAGCKPIVGAGTSADHRPGAGGHGPSQPDFVLRCDDDHIRPVAMFTDGFEFHCHPNNRLADDMQKRRAIVESGNYHVWSITWDDLTTDRPEHPMVCHPQVAKTLAEYAGKANGMKLPDAGQVIRNGMEQLKAFLHNPVGANWKVLAHFTAFWPLQLLYGKRRVFQTELRQGPG